MVTVKCDWCGKLIKKYPRDIRRTKHHFCNKACYDTYQRGGQIQYCDNCGKRVSRRPSRWQNQEHVFCSVKCYSEFARKGWQSLACDNCGKSFRLPKAVYKLRLGQNNEHFFCCRECWEQWQAGEKNPNWHGGYESYRGPNWKQQRDRARKRDGFCCRVCSISEKELGQELSVHHLIPFRQFGLEKHQAANCLANLCSLCPSHHKELEQLDLKEQIRRITGPEIANTTRPLPG